MIRLEHWFRRNAINRRYWLALIYHLMPVRRRRRREHRTRRGGWQWRNS